MEPTQPTQPIRPKALTFAVALAMGAIAQGVQAAPITYGNITLDATYSLNGGATQDGMTDPQTSIFPPPNGGPNGADMYLFKSDGGGGIGVNALSSNVFFHTYGFTSPNTYFGARASGEGHFAAATRASYSGLFTNPTASAQPFIFDFHVDFGEIGVTGTGAGSADLLLRIRLNGVEVQRDHTTITQLAGGGVTCAEDDLGTLGSYMSCPSLTSGNASANGRNFSINLGSVNPGQNFTLDYDIIATVSGNLTNGTRQECTYGGGYGITPEAVADPYGGGGDPPVCVDVPVPGGAIARSGDPFDGPNFNDRGNPGTIGQLQPNLPPAAVHEPGSLALAAIALAGLAGATRRRRRDDETSR